MESANLKAEIRRLRIENGDLMKRVRFADSNAHYMRVRLVYSWLHKNCTLAWNEREINSICIPKTCTTTHTLLPHCAIIIVIC